MISHGFKAIETVFSFNCRPFDTDVKNLYLHFLDKMIKINNGFNVDVKALTLYQNDFRRNKLWQ